MQLVIGNGSIPDAESLAEAYFHVHAESNFVYFDLHPAEGSDLSETEKLFLLGRLSEILICNYKGRFFDIHIGWS